MGGNWTAVCIVGALTGLSFGAEVPTERYKLEYVPAKQIECVESHRDRVSGLMMKDRIDHKEATEQVFIGRRGSHPPRMPFIFAVRAKETPGTSPNC